MASITKRGDSYRIAVSNGYHTDGRKIVHTKTWTPPPGMTEKQATKDVEKVANEFENSIKRGLTMGGTITLEAFSKRWIQEHVEKQLDENTATSYQHELDSKILPAIGHMRLRAIQPVHIIAFLDQISKPGVRVDGKEGTYAARTIKYQLDILSSLFRYAVYMQILEVSPCDRVKPPARKDAMQERVKYFTDEQTVIFLNAIQDEPSKYILLATLGIFVGSRRGEVLALLWQDINFDKGEIDISKQHAYLPQKGIYAKATKTRSSSRIVSIPPSVVMLLRQYKQEQAQKQLALGSEWKGTGHIFTQWNGLPMATSTPRGWMNKFLKRYNERIQTNTSLTKEEKERLTLPIIPYHGLRHTSATLLLAENTALKTVSARLGHSLLSTTGDIYAHQLRTADDRAADLLESTLMKKNKKGQEI